MIRRILFITGLALLVISLAGFLLVQTRPVSRTSGAAHLAPAPVPQLTATPATGPSPTSGVPVPTPTTAAPPTVGPTGAPPTPTPASGAKLTPSPLPSPTIAATATNTPTATPRPIGLLSRPRSVRWRSAIQSRRFQDRAPLTHSKIAENLSATWPTDMDKGQGSDNITVTFAHYLVGTPVQGTPQPGQAVAVATPQFPPDATPGVLLEQAYGPAYDACGRASLSAVGFTVNPTTQDCLSLRPVTVAWSWNISPSQSGMFKPEIRLDVTWKPVGGGDPSVRGPYPVWITPVQIHVHEPWFLIGQINLFALLSVIGTGLVSGVSVPWLYGQYHDRKTSKEEPSDTAQGSGAPGAAQHQGKPDASRRTGQKGRGRKGP